MILSLAKLKRRVYFIHCTGSSSKKRWLTLNTDFKNKTHLLNVFVHRVPLHSECVGQLYRLFSRGSLCFCGLLLKVVDDSHSYPMLCTFWSGNTKLKTVKWHTPGWKILEYKTWFRNAQRRRTEENNVMNIKTIVRVATQAQQGT